MTSSSCSPHSHRLDHHLPLRSVPPHQNADVVAVVRSDGQRDDYSVATTVVAAADYYYFDAIVAQRNISDSHVNPSKSSGPWLDVTENTNYYLWNTAKEIATQM